MNESDPKLLEGLRALAADGPREAPAHVEERLLGELRRRSRARRRNLWLAAGAGAIAAGIALLIWIRPSPTKPAPMVAQLAAPVKREAVVQASTLAPASQKAVRMRRAPKRGAEVAINFYPLPGADELPPVESATIIRVQLPMSSLRLIGVPVSEERAGDSVQADMLLGQDGLARGVRFVQ
jgi:hypothetical protein